jgi:hypothetical protein
MAVLDTAIFLVAERDARIKCGHDEKEKSGWSG